uniref:Uncharacterized protein n=1 Tax=Anser cygnoides TaxID=8845 RepID=A0A8B9E8W2_ANSCY
MRSRNHTPENLATLSQDNSDSREEEIEVYTVKPFSYMPTDPERNKKKYLLLCLLIFHLPLLKNCAKIYVLSTARVLKTCTKIFYCLLAMNESFLSFNCQNFSLLRNIS